LLRASVLVWPFAIRMPPAPETCGHAIDVPLKVSVPSEEDSGGTVERTSFPGAASSTSGPVEEKSASESSVLVADTAMTSE
jgi:hypothetical protein